MSLSKKRQLEAARRKWLIAQVASALPTIMDAGDDADALAEMIVDGNGRKNVAAVAVLRRQLRDHFVYGVRSPEAFGAASRLNGLLQQAAS